MYTGRAESAEKEKKRSGEKVHTHPLWCMDMCTLSPLLCPWEVHLIIVRTKIKHLTDGML